MIAKNSISKKIFANIIVLAQIYLLKEICWSIPEELYLMEARGYMN